MSPLSQTDLLPDGGDACNAVIAGLFLEVVDEGGYALHGFLASFLYLDDKLHVGLDGTAQVLNLIQ